jgi:farnesyl diphosphate synthase
MENYSSLVKHKTSYYSFVLPVRLVMILAEFLRKSDVYSAVEVILLEIGHFFQVHNDFLDCFGDPKKTGKKATDIQESKCTWLFVESVRLCKGSHQEELLKEDYLAAKSDPKAVEEVRRIYESLEIREHYSKYMRERLSSLQMGIDQLRDAPDFPSGLKIMLQTVVTQPIPMNA